MFPKLVNTADYVVPQDRWRVIMIVIKKELVITNYEFSKPFQTKITIEDALKGLASPKTNDICQGAFSSRYMSRNRKRKWNEVSYTIPAMRKQVALHPSSPDMKKIGDDLWKFGEVGETRRFSWQEAAEIQTFPKDMNFIGAQRIVFSRNLTSSTFFSKTDM